MNRSEKIGTPFRVRRPEVLVAPVITFIAVVVLLIVARFYDRLPVQAPECGFKATTGIPCLSCGGTRSMIAFSHGDFPKAFAFNPAVFAGVMVTAVWFGLGWRRYLVGATPLSPSAQNRRIIRVALIIGGVLVLNWIYLFLFLDQVDLASASAR